MVAGAILRALTPRQKNKKNICAPNRHKSILKRNMYFRIKGKRQKMTIEEQNVFLSREYAEASRYMDNAKETLQKARKEDDGLYKDQKYVRTACGTAYNGVLYALDAWFVMKGVTNTKKGNRKSIDFYKYNISQIDKKVAKHFDAVYSTLHLSGYYDGCLDVKVIQAGFERAYYIINKIKPENFVEVKDTKINAARRAVRRMALSLAVMFRV
jgi:uncharacterized protein (UPF0332 family)